MCRYLIVNPLVLNHLLTCLNSWKYQNLFMKLYYKILIKKPTREYSNCDDHSRKIRGETAPSNTYSKMSESTVKLRKRYVDHLKDISKHNCPSMTPVICHINPRSWGTLVFSIIKSVPLSTSGMIP